LKEARCHTLPYLEADERRQMTGGDFFNLLMVIGMYTKHTGNALLFATRRVQQNTASFKL
jgi:hypothetical protein